MSEERKELFLGGHTLGTVEAPQNDLDIVWLILSRRINAV